MSKVISFKLSPQEYEALVALQQDSEKSPSLTAKRLIVDALSLPVSQPVSTTQNLEGRLNALKDELIHLLQPQIDEIARVAGGTRGESLA